jgi:hypothetical protein
MMVTAAVLVGVLAGEATFYSAGVFDQVWIQYRSTYMAPCVECVGYAAMYDESFIGSKVWITHNGDTVGPLYVIDCGEFLTPNRIVEVDESLFVKWRKSAPIDVTLSFQDPGECYEDSCVTGMREVWQAYRTRSLHPC